jgi:YD repeat-containing protein
MGNDSKGLSVGSISIKNDQTDPLERSSYEMLGSNYASGANAYEPGGSLKRAVDGSTSMVELDDSRKDTHDEMTIRFYGANDFDTDSPYAPNGGATAIATLVIEDISSDISTKGMDGGVPGTFTGSGTSYHFDREYDKAFRYEHTVGGVTTIREVYYYFDPAESMPDPIMQWAEVDEEVSGGVTYRRIQEWQSYKGINSDPNETELIYSEILKTTSGGSSTEISQTVTREMLQLDDYGEVVTQRQDDPWGTNGSNGADLTTQYIYDTVPSDPGSSYLRLTIHPDGSWSGYSKVDITVSAGNPPVEERKTLMPWKDSPAAPTGPSYTLPSADSCKTITDTYTGGKLTSSATKILTAQVGNRDITHTSGTDFDTRASKRYANASSWFVTESVSFDLDYGEPELRGRTAEVREYNSNNSGGSWDDVRNRTVYQYHTGEFDTATGDVLKDAGYDTTSPLRITEVYDNPPDTKTSMPDAAPDLTDSYSGHSPHFMTQTVVEAATGRTVQSERLISNGMSYASISKTEYSYDSRGRVTAVATNDRTTSSTVYNTEYKTTRTDAAGSVTESIVDPFGRITSTTHKGAASKTLQTGLSSAAQNDIITEYTYAARTGGGQATTIDEKAYGGGSYVAGEVITTSSETDRVGRIAKSTDRSAR